MCVWTSWAHIYEYLIFAMQNWVRQIGIKALTDCRTINLIRNDYVAICDTCLRVKIEHQRLVGLLQPMKIPEWKCEKLEWIS